MSHLAMRDDVPPDARQPATAADPLGPVRAVSAAVVELRRGAPVALRAGTALMLVAVETASEASLALLDGRGSGPARLLLTALRGNAVLGSQPNDAEPVAIWLSPSEHAPQVLRSLADPTMEQARHRWTPAPAPDGAAAALALVKLARLLPAAVAVPVIDWAGLATVTPAEVLGYPQAIASNLQLVSEARVPLEDARDSRVLAFRGLDGGPEHLAILIGHPETAAAPLARIHSECFTGDVLGSLRCDCGPQLRDAIRRMAQEGCGVLLYLAQEGRGIGLANKLRAYAMQDRGLDTVDANRALGWEADERSFPVAAAMLRALGIARVRLLTNNPEKVAALADHGIAVERHSLLVAANGVNDSYLATKAIRFGHLAS